MHFSSSDSNTVHGDASGQHIIESPPVGIYVVTVFGNDNASEQPRKFSESFTFFTIEG